MRLRETKVTAPFDPAATPEQRRDAIRGLAESLSKDKRPILLGPFRSELGFEASYFQPFIAWLAGAVKGFNERAVMVTRGGLAPLYPGIAKAVDLYTIRSVAEVRRENKYDQRTHGLQKQVQQTAWDTRVLEDAARALGMLPGYHVVHPAWMYWGLAPYWDEAQGLRYLKKFTDYAPLAAPPAFNGMEHLPKDYVAVKFYARATFPYPDAEVEEAVTRICATLAAQVPVVVLSSANDYDDHTDLRIEGPNIFSIAPGCPPQDNLLMQAAVLARAKAFVGTYGGMAQLALRFKVPSVSFWKTFGGTAHAHLSLQSWVSKATNVPFVAGSIAETSLLQSVLAVPMVVPPQPMPAVIEAEP